MLENTEGAIKKGQARETGNIGNTRRRKGEKKPNTICIGHHYMKTSTNNVNKIRFRITEHDMENPVFM